MPQSILVHGIPMELTGRPWLSAEVESPIQVGEHFTLNEKTFVVIQADPVTKPNQLQNVYVKEEPNDQTQTD